MLTITWVYIGLSAISLVSVLIGRPWTSVIARRSNPREVWDTAIFLETNRLLSGAWALLFGGAALIAQFGSATQHVLAGVGMSALGIASNRIGRWYSERKLSEMGIDVGASGDVLETLQDQIDAQNPWNWASPLLDSSIEEAGDFDVIVIGSGAGGLTAAALLSKAGHRVAVLEQHTIAGGYCHSWKRMVHLEGGRARAQFDAGVHDVSGTHPGGSIDNVLHLLGVQDRVEWRPVTQEYVVGEERIRIPEDWKEFVGELGDRYPADRERVAALFDEMKAVHDGLFSTADWELGVPRPPQTVDGMLAFSSEHATALKWRSTRFVDMLDEFLSEPKLKQLLTVLTGYLTDRPTDLTVGNMAPIFGYYFNGGRYPKGGSQRLPDVLVEVIREAGGEVRFKAEVERIIAEDGAVAGVRLADGSSLRSKAVVCNADLARTVNGLLEGVGLPTEFSSRFGALETSTSALAVQLVVDFVPDVAPITIVASDSGLGLGVSVPTLVDPGLAPPGCAGIELLSFVSNEESATWDRDDPEYESRKRKACDELVERAAAVVPGLEDRIVFREDSTPRTFEHFAWVEGGAIYGPTIHADRPPAKTPLRGLVLAGSGVFPGPGVEAVVISGALAAHAIDPAGVEALGRARAESSES